MNNDRIGQAAGVLWERLSTRSTDGASITELKKIPGLTQDEVVAALGWLAREGKLEFARQGGRKTAVRLAEALTS